MAGKSKPTPKAPASVQRPRQYKNLRNAGLSHETAKRIAGPKKGK